MPWYQRWRNVFRPERLHAELDNEFEFHLAETVDRLLAGGMSEKEAWRQARLRLGNYSIQKERTRDMNIAAWLDATRADFVYGLRQLKLNPGFAAVAVLSLALGIGANTAIFQLVNAIRLKMLPVRKPLELVSIDFEKHSARVGWWSSRSANFTYAEWEQIRNRQQAFTGVLAWSATRFNLASGGEPRFAEGLYVSGDFFRHLGVNAIVGRTLAAQDDSGTCSAGAVLSHAFWQREFGGEPNILGRTVSLDGHSLPILGVTPPSFFGVEVGSRYDVAVPLCADRLLAEDGKGRIPVPSAWWLSMMGRLKPEWTAKSAAAHLRTLSPEIMRAVAGAALGAGLALALSRALVAFINTRDQPLFVGLALDWRMLGFTAALAVLTCLLFGLLPALRATYLSPVATLRAGDRSMTAGRDRLGLRRALVATQVALSLVLLVGALLFVRSLHNLLTNDAGFQPEGVLTVNIDFSKAPYPKERRLLVYREFVRSFVRSAGCPFRSPGRLHASGRRRLG
jgi:hypothetical protein